MSDAAAESVENLLSVVNRRTAIAAVRAEAARAGLDAEQLFDSMQLSSRVMALDVDDPGFPRRVSEIVREHAAARGLTSTDPSQTGQPQAGDAAAAEADDERQWTEADVKAASTADLRAAMERGQLTALGVGRRRGHR